MVSNMVSEQAQATSKLLLRIQLRILVQWMDTVSTVVDTRTSANIPSASSSGSYRALADGHSWLLQDNIAQQMQ